MTTSTTQLSISDLRNQIAQLEKVRIMVCDTIAFDVVSEAINLLKIEANAKLNCKVYNV